MVTIELTETQINVARMIAMGINFDDIAEEFKINRSTIYRWRQLDYFNDEINRLIKTAKSKSSDRIVRDITEIKNIVLSTLVDVAQNDNSGSARVSAAKALSEMVEKAEGDSAQDSVMEDQSDKIINMLEVIQQEQLAVT